MLHSTNRRRRSAGPPEASERRESCVTHVVPMDAREAAYPTYLPASGVAGTSDPQASNALSSLSSEPILIPNYFSDTIDFVVRSHVPSFQLVQTERE